MHTPLCNNGENPCPECLAEMEKEEKNAASREREKNLARRAVLAQNGIIEAALDLTTHR